MDHIIFWFIFPSFDDPIVWDGKLNSQVVPGAETGEGFTLDGRQQQLQILRQDLRERAASGGQVGKCYWVMIDTWLDNSHFIHSP